MSGRARCQRSAGQRSSTPLTWDCGSRPPRMARWIVGRCDPRVPAGYKGASHWLTVHPIGPILWDMNQTRTRTVTVAYCRVSTDKQADRGVSLEAQRAKVEAYAALYDLELVAIEVDAGESAKSLARPALDRALAMLRSGKAEALLVVKLDRLTRNVRDLADLVDTYFTRRAALLSVSEQIDTRSAAGRLVLNVLSSVGQWEREAIGERTSAAMQHKASHGEYTGGNAPYGYAVAVDGVALVEVAAEQAVISEARALRAAGLSLRKVAELLASKGLLTRTGHRFAPKAIVRMTA